MDKNHIYETLNLSILTDDLLNIIIANNIPHTSNKNGTFINISLLDDSHLKILYGHINSINEKKTNNTINNNHEIQLIPMEEKKKKNIKSNQTYKKLKLSGLEQQIISFS